MKNNLPNGSDIIFARSIEEVEEIRNVWQRMQTHPNSDIDFFLSVVNSRTSILKPHVMLFRRDETPIALLIGRIENYPFGFNFGYKTIYQTNIRTLIIIYEGILGDSSSENSKLLFTELLRSFQREKIKLIFINSLKNNSHFYKTCKTETNFFFRDHISVPNTHWRMAIPEDMAAFYEMRSRKHRYWLRRLSKVLDKDFSNNIKTKIIFNQNDVDLICNDAEKVASKTYHRAIGAGFKDGVETRHMFTHLAENSQLRAYFLYINEKPGAFWIGRQYGNTFYLSYTGYLPEYERYELGTILFLKMLEDLCTIKAIRFLDFGFGDAPYKKRFGDMRWQETSVYIFPCTFEGMLLNALRTITALVYKISIGMLNRFNLLAKVKKLWRSQMAAKVSLNNKQADSDDERETIGKK